MEVGEEHLQDAIKIVVYIEVSGQPWLNIETPSQETNTKNMNGGLAKLLRG